LTDNKVAPHEKKLLAFSDNRQDASLQAGHFNDFIVDGEENLTRRQVPGRFCRGKPSVSNGGLVDLEMHVTIPPRMMRPCVIRLGD
jgi:hypothetical protein